MVKAESSTPCSAAARWIARLMCGLVRKFIRSELRSSPGAPSSRAGMAASPEIDPIMYAPVTYKSTASRSEEHTSELQSLMRISYAVFCLKKKKNEKTNTILHKQTEQKTAQVYEDQITI